MKHILFILNLHATLENQKLIKFHNETSLQKKLFQKAASERKSSRIFFTPQFLTLSKTVI